MGATAFIGVPLRETMPCICRRLRFPPKYNN